MSQGFKRLGLKSILSLIFICITTRKITFLFYSKILYKLKSEVDKIINFIIKFFDGQILFIYFFFHRWSFYNFQVVENVF